MKISALGGAAWYCLGAEAHAGPRKKMIVVLLRGGLDGLSLIIPQKEKAYLRKRPDIAVRNPLDLNGDFGLSPRLEPLLKLYRDGLLAPLVAVGSPSLTRSHFDAQDFLETGTPDLKSTADGWLNRYLQARPEPRNSVWRAVALSKSTPRILQGPAPSMATSGKNAFQGRKGQRMEEAFAAMYAKEPGELGAAGRGALDSVDELEEMRDMKEADRSASAGAPADRARQRLAGIGRIAAAEEAFEVGVVDLGGWDTHVNQGGQDGQLARRLGDLGLGLTKLVEELGPALQDTVVVALTEFGRTVAQNGNGGTDHGHASCALVLGGPVRGGQVFGRWPGLDQKALHEGRDLAVTTDFRHIFGELLASHLGARELEKIFPGFQTRPQDWLGLVRA